MTDKEFIRQTLLSPNPGRIVYSDWGLQQPEIAALHNCPQDAEWHPEGDAGKHTGMVIDETYDITCKYNLSPDQQLILGVAALCHDFAKPETTEERLINGRIRITAWGHEEAGGPIARRFLERIGFDETFITEIVALVENHLRHMLFDGSKPTNKAIRRLKEKLKPTSVEMLCYLIEADASGRSPAPKGIPPGVLVMRDALNNCDENNFVKPPVTTLLNGNDLIALGVKPGPDIGQMLQILAEQEEKGMCTLQEAVEYVQDYLKI